MQRMRLREDAAVTALLLLLLAAAIAAAVWMTVRRVRKGSACCGDKAPTVARTGPKDKRRADYPYTAVLHITGMTCENCARRVENALNAQDGVLAKVDLGTATARIRTSAPPDTRRLCGIVAAAGYVAEAAKK